MKVSELPPGIRVKLSRKADERLWKEVDRIGGVRQFSDVTDFSASRLYNWKNKTDFYPAGFVVEVLGGMAGQRVEAYKGGGRSIPTNGPVFPVPENPELLTRVECSVSVNEDGVPFYRTRERSLAERFKQLLSELGDVPLKEYRRSSGHEVRYPAYIHRILDKMDFDPDVPALVDEEGSVEGRKIIVKGREIPVNRFDGVLHSRTKKLELALRREDSDEVGRLIKEESERVRSLFG